ncbi:aspartic peptidase domain-containing protein [Mycena polygramma]|nr:aspartic peptidase domain-containing protein [Mycena polygramma]
MRFLGFLFLFSAVAPQASALALQGTPVPIVSRATPAGVTLQPVAVPPGNGTINSIDVRYAVNITVNGKNFRVAIDTGSSDLWIVPPQDFEFQDTGITVENRYINSSLTGTIGFASVELGGYKSKQQVFNNATSVPQGQGISEVGLDGLIGLAFDGILESDIQAELIANGSDPSVGAPFLYNIFNQTPNQDNYIGISLARTGDLEGTADASFTINEVDDTYAAVANSSKISLFRPGGEGGWLFLVDAILVDDTRVTPPPSIFSGVPAGKLLAAPDTGTPFMLLPQILLDDIFSSIPGSVLKLVEAVDGTDPVWTIPCNTTTIVSFQIGEQSYPIHPLDLSDVFSGNGTDEVVCATLWGGGSGVNGGIDILLGDSFLRNAYMQLNYGNAISHSRTANSSIQLLSHTDPVAAAADVLKVRMALLSNLSSAGSTATAQGASVAHGANAGGSPVAAALDNTNGSSSNASDNADVSKYGPIVIGLLGGNLLVTLLLLAVGVAQCIKRSGRAGSGKGSGKYAQVRIAPEEARPLDSYDSDKRYSD